MKDQVIASTRPRPASARRARVLVTVDGFLGAHYPAMLRDSGVPLDVDPGVRHVDDW